MNSLQTPEKPMLHLGADRVQVMCSLCSGRHRW